jgi:hypothetical protein
MKPDTLAKDLLHRINAHWRVPDHLSVGQFLLYCHSLLSRPAIRLTAGMKTAGRHEVVSGTSLIATR